MAAAKRKSLCRSESLMDVLVRATVLQCKQNENIAPNKVLQLDLPVIKGPSLTVIDWYLSDYCAVNRYLFQLIRKVLERTKSNEDEYMVEAMSKYKDTNEILILDGLNAFDLIEFSKTLTDRKNLEKILMATKIDPFSFLSIFHTFYPEQIAFNVHLKLVIVFVCDKNVKEVMACLARQKLRIHVVLVAYNYPRFYRKGTHVGEVQSINFIKVTTVNHQKMSVRADKQEFSESQFRVQSFS